MATTLELLDPLYLNSDDECVLCCNSEFSLEILKLMRTMDCGKDARAVGHVSGSPMGRVRMHHRSGHASFVETLR